MSEDESSRFHTILAPQDGAPFQMQVDILSKLEKERGYGFGRNPSC